MRKRTLKHGINNKGLALVESAIVLTVFLMLLFGIMDFGRALYAYHFVGYAAREATRYAIVRGSESGIGASATDVANFVKNTPTASPPGILQPGLDPTKMTVSTTWPDGDNKRGHSVRVQVQYIFQFLLPFMPSSWTLNSTSQMIISQ